MLTYLAISWKYCVTILNLISQRFYYLYLRFVLIKAVAFFVEINVAFNKVKTRCKHSIFNIHPSLSVFLKITMLIFE